MNGTVSPPTAAPSKVQGGSPYKVSQRAGTGLKWVSPGLLLESKGGKGLKLSQRPELDVVGFTLGCHELDPIFLVFLQL